MKRWRCLATIVGLGLGCRGSEFLTGSGGAGAAGGAGASAPGGGGSGGSPEREVLVEVVGLTGRPLADRPIIIGDADGETTQAGVTDIDGDLLVTVSGSGSITAIVNEGTLAHTIILSSDVDHVRFVDPSGGENAQVDVTIVGNCPDCAPGGPTEFSITCETYRREIHENSAISEDFISVGGCPGEADVDVSVLNYTTQGALSSFAIAEDVPLAMGPINVGELVLAQPADIATVSVTWIGPVPAAADDVAMLRFDGSARTVLAKWAWDDAAMSVQIPSAFSAFAQISYRFDLEGDAFVFASSNVAEGPITFDTEELDTPDEASHQSGTPEKILWSSSGETGDAVELIITRENGGQLVWAPPDAQEIVLPKLPSPFGGLATGDVTTIEVRNHASDTLEGYGAFLADSTWPLRPNAVVAGRTFPLL